MNLTWRQSEGKENNKNEGRMNSVRSGEKDQGAFSKKKEKGEKKNRSLDEGREEEKEGTIATKIIRRGRRRGKKKGATWSHRGALPTNGN